MRYIIILILLLTGFLGLSQNPRLAENYMDQGEYNKALKLYKTIYLKDQRNINHLYNLIDAYQQLERYPAVDSLITHSYTTFNNNPTLTIERGYNYKLQGNDSIAQTYFNQTIERINNNPREAYQIAHRLEQRNLIDHAITAYELAMQVEPKHNFNYQLANLYGQKGDLEAMFDKYLTLIENNQAYQARAQAVFAQYVTQESQNPGNQLLRKALLVRLRENQNPLYNRLLSWLFVQQKEFDKAFIQEKAIYLRERQNTNNLQDLAHTAIDENNLDAARNILQYLIAESQVLATQYTAHRLLARIDADNATPHQYDSIINNYQQLLSTYGTDNNTLLLQMDYAEFLAFKADQPTVAIDLLSKLSINKLNKQQQAQVRMLLADILVLQEQFNRALILYSKIQTDVPNDEIAQQAQFKVARTSYYTGDFKWALTQLKVLRDAASKLIANDAMLLSLTISDNSLQDTTYLALKSFAQADLKYYQNKPQQAITLYNQLLQQHKGHDIEDDALYNQAQIYTQQQQYQLAINNYQLILDNYHDGILADDTLYQLGLLYQQQLDNPQQAQHYFERIIYDYPDSIHFVDARRRYRKLRGDTNQKAF